MFLSRLLLNSNSREVRRDIHDCHQLHRTVMSAFPQTGEQARAQYQVLHRLEEDERSGRIALLVQSGVSPDWTRLPPGYLLPGPGSLGCKEIGAHFEAILPGQVLRFRLLANTTKKVKAGPEGIRPNGRRVMLSTEEEQIAWLQRRAAAGGFALIEVSAAPGVLDVMTRAVGGGRVHGRHSAGKLSFGAVLFEGRLRVTDVERFRGTLREGIGSAKAYGFGLLSVAGAR